VDAVIGQEAVAVVDFGIMAAAVAAAATYR
jgi:hypothetical protein